VEGEKLRAFLAIEPSEAARRAAAEAASAIRRAPGGDSVRWVRPEALHVTLRFLGDIDPELVPRLEACVGADLRPLAPFALRLGGVGGFPNPRRPRVVTLGLEPEEPLAELASAVERGVVAAGCEPESRPFRGHLTLGRARGRSARVTGAVTATPESFRVEEVVLFQSRLGPGGAKHTPLARFPLEGKPQASGDL